PEDSAELVRARAALPHGRVGELAFDQQRQAVEVFYQRLHGVNPGIERQTRAFGLPFDTLRLSGQLTELDEQGLLLYRLRPVSVWDRLSLWVRHLALNCLRPAGIACRSQWLGEDRSLSIEPIAHAPDLLRDLLSLYWEGLHRPLPLFPRSSRAYAAASRRSRSDPLRAARNTWIGNEHSRGERDDPYNSLCFRGADPLDEEFSELALRVFSPPIECVLEESA
ncbi:MAG: exodeoxyribonuclease V subunit gamma, partial [Gammaproteobacteria bacterium]